MLSYKLAAVTLVCLSSASALPIRHVPREVPQEHSHEPFLTSVRASLALNNPDGITDPVFGLLGNAAAIGGAGKITDATCLQQATADRAFTNAKAAGDIQGQVDALIYRALERNSGQVGLVTDPCTSIKAVNPEIAAIQQHQDPASTNASAVNKAITLELAKQIASVGGDPQDALKAGTFAPGDLNDSTAKGHTCDDANDLDGCIFTQNLLVPDATADEINAAVAGSSNASTASTTATSASSPTDVCPPPTTVTVTVGSAQETSGSVSSSTVTSAATSTITSPAAGSNLQTFTGALGGATAPAVTAGGKGFQVAGSDSFINEAGAIGRSCDIQHNQCADIANSATGRSAGLSVGQCDDQNTQCHAAASQA